MSSGGVGQAVLSGDFFDTAEDVDETLSWEQPMERTWEEVEEDESGRLKSLRMMQQKAIKRRLEQASEKSGLVEKGMIRYLYLVIDFSGAMDDNDLKPNRRLVSIVMVEDFINEFFDQNPISQLGLMVVFNKKAIKLTELSGNPANQIQRLKSFAESGGDFSLQSALEIAKTSLCQIPSYGSREVLVVMGSLGTCDAGDIVQTIDQLGLNRIRCSVISLSAEVFVCKSLCNKTKGNYDVALDKEHFRELLFKSVVPLPATVDSSENLAKRHKPSRKWIKMGFPQQESERCPSLCACHNEFKYQGYVCPKCKTKCCELPTDCLICGLTLVSSPHLARSYHHLFPVPFFDQILDTESTHLKNCFACQRHLTKSSNVRVRCPDCKRVFCVQCDVYIHQSLHNCPGCYAGGEGEAEGGPQAQTALALVAS